MPRSLAAERLSPCRLAGQSKAMHMQRSAAGLLAGCRYVLEGLHIYTYTSFIYIYILYSGYTGINIR